MKKAVYRIAHAVRNKLGSKITIQLLFIFSFCALVSIMIFYVSMFFVRRAAEEYDQLSKRMVIDGHNLSMAMQNETLNSDDTEKIGLIVDSVLEGKAYNIVITDLNGNILYSSSEEQIERPSMNIAMSDNPSTDTIIIDTESYAIKQKDTILQLSVISSDKAGWIVRCYKNGMLPGFTAFLSILIFIFLFLVLTRKKISYITEIASGVKIMSKGSLNYRIRVNGNNELTLLAKELNYMAGELDLYFEREKNREKSKTELMISVSHDLKSPLTAVIGYLSLLKDKELDKDAAAADYVERAYQKTLRIKELLQELLDFASLSSEDIKLNKQPISLRHLLDQLISEYTSIFKQKELQIITSLSDENVQVEVDPSYIIRVFENLLSNSLRYSPKPGEIKITLDYRDNSLLFSITNRCEKIEEVELERLFDKFYRLEKSRSQETGGTGLGLAIAKRITELHDGKIWAEYSNGEITLWVMLPAKAKMKAIS